MLILPLAMLPAMRGGNGAAGIGACPVAVQKASPATSCRRALATPCFWIFALSISFFGFLTSGVSLFLQYVIEERGFGERVFQMALIVTLLSGFVFNLLAGACLRRFAYQRVLACGLAILSASLVLFPWMTELGHVVVYATLYGAAGGILTVVYFSVWRHAFGPTHLGAIQAMAQIPTVLASAAGPVFVAFMESRSGSYGSVLVGSAAMAMLLAAIAWWTPVPRASLGDSLQ
jgi:MFS family permease